MGSWCSQIRQEWGQGAFYSPVFQHLPSVTQDGGEEPSQPALGEWLNSSGFLRIIIICVYDLVCGWRSEGLILGYSLTEPISPVVVVHRTFFLNALQKNIGSYQTSSFMT